MHLITTLALAALTTALPTTSSSSKIGNAVVTNNCPSPIYLWSVGSSVSPKHTLAPGANYTEPFHHDLSSGGIALKITRTDNGLYDGGAQLTYSYTLDAATASGAQNVWYDLGSVFGDAFKGEGLVVKPAENSGCESICWAEGVAPSGGSQVKRCDATAGDVELVVCADGC